MIYNNSTYGSDLKNAFVNSLFNENHSGQILTPPPPPSAKFLLDNLGDPLLDNTTQYFLIEE